MLLLDRLIEAQDKTSTCEVTITPHSLFVEPRGMPAFVGIEYMAQAIAAHGGYRSYQRGDPIEVGFLMGTPRWKSYDPFFDVGQTIRIQVVHIWGEHEVMRFHCTITDGNSGALLQQADLNVFRPKDLQAYLRGVKS